MSSENIGIEEARKRLGDLVTAVQQGADIILTRNGKPAARIIAHKEPAMTALQIITNVEDAEAGYTRGWIVPVGTDQAADLELEAVDHVDIPATEDPAEWHQGLVDELAAAGYALTGPVRSIAAISTVTVARCD